MRLSLGVYWVDVYSEVFKYDFSCLIIDATANNLASVYKDRWDLHATRLNHKSSLNFGTCSSIEEGKKAVEDILRKNGVIIEDINKKNGVEGKKE